MARPTRLADFAGAGPARRSGPRASRQPTTAPECKNAGVTVGFVSGSNEIDRTASGALAGVATWLQNGDQRSVRLEGYADKKGGATANQRLSERRAQAAKDFLLSRGIEPDRIMVFGHGEGDDVALTGSEARVVVVTACDIPKAVAAETPPAPEARAGRPRPRAGRAASRHPSRRAGRRDAAATPRRRRAGHRRPAAGGQTGSSGLRGGHRGHASAAARSASSTKPLAASPAPAAPGMRG